MDIQMPIMDGYEATRAIRSWEEAVGNKRTTIIALTAHALKEDLQKSLDAGCDAHLTKPLKKATFLGAIDRLANKDRHQIRSVREI
jgi:CheY-like chemotaxis protein